MCSLKGDNYLQYFQSLVEAIVFIYELLVDFSFILFRSSEGGNEEEQYTQCVEGQYGDMKYFPNNPNADGMIREEVFGSIDFSNQ